MKALDFSSYTVFEHAWIFPVAAVSCLLIGMLSGYVIGVGIDHYPAVLPFISDGGANKPEASIFAQFLNLAAFFYVITLYIRHLQIAAYYEEHSRWRYASFWLMLEGFASAFGLSLVANFRENDVFEVHIIGALIAFFGMVIYGWGQLILSYALKPRLVSAAVNHVRLVIMALTTAFLILNMVTTFGKVAVPSDAGPRPRYDDIKGRLNKNSAYYKNSVIAASSEWGMALVMQLFMISLVFEMSAIRISAPQVIYKEDYEADCDIAL